MNTDLQSDNFLFDNFLSNNIIIIILGILIGYFFAEEYTKIGGASPDLLDEVNRMTQSPLI